MVQLRGRGQEGWGVRRIGRQRLSQGAEGPRGLGGWEVGVVRGAEKRALQFTQGHKA